MNHQTKFFYLLLALLATTLIASVSGSYHVVMSETHMSFFSKELASAYKASVVQAKNFTNEKITKSLFPISKSNSKLRWRTIEGEEYLLVTNVFEDDTKYEGKEQILLDHGDVWVSAFPQLYDFCLDYIEKHPEATMPDIGLRIHQLLGLPANKVDYTLVEFWVRPSDLFRPCADPDISSEKCSIHFPEDVAEEHASWINALREATYEDGEKDIEYGGFPWTQLGYTYDWSPESKDNIGLSEYVVKKGSKVYVQNVYTLDEYCQAGF